MNNVNWVRFGWGIFYLIAGIVLIFISFQVLEILKWLFVHWQDLAWVLGWSNIGIGAGLINSRNKDGKRDKDHMHYVLYFGFALFVATLAGISLAREGSALKYPLSALISLTVGFAAEKLNDLVPLK